MRGGVYLFLVVLVLSFVAGLESKECPKRCDCADTYKPVCGSSKRTHGNACLAQCFGDKVVHEGECKQKCSTFSGVKRGHSCSWIKQGKYSTRKQCCVWKERCLVGKCRRTGRSCRIVGQSKTVKPQSKCSWVKQGKSKRRRCCYWVLNCIGSKCKRTQNRCEFIGKRLVSKNGCKWNLLKKGSRQQVCCKTVKGKKTCTKGPIIQTSIQNTCNWKKVSKGCQRRQCCQYKKRCQGKQCKSKLLRCAFRSQVVCTRPEKKCFFKKTGANCRRMLCCNSHRRCVGKKCAKINPKCEFKGEERCTTKHQRCVYQKRSKKVSQLRCCVSTRQCIGKRCSTFGKRCSWKGKRIVTKVKKGCFWKITGKDTKRRMCCKRVKSCKGKKCKTQKKKCTFKGPIVKENQLMKCQWSKYGKYGKRKRCCSSFQRCVASKCKTLNKRCAYVGEVISKRKQSGCSIKKVKGGKRKQCCSWIRQCYGNTCTNVKKTCKWSGAVVKRQKRCSCKWTQRKDKKQRRCCCVHLKCQKKKCKSQKQSCKWVGSAISTKVKSGCSWKPYGKTGKRKSCCKSTLKCKNKKCKKTSNKCKWFGPVVRQSIKSICRRSKVATNAVQRKCCKFLKHCIGKQCKLTKLNCKLVGEVIRVTRHKKCSFKKESKGVRRVCCVWTRICKGKRCAKRNVKCRKQGQLIRTFRKCSCSFVKKSATQRQNKCCCKTTICKGIECKVKSNKCRWQGNVVSNVWVHNCRIQKFGKNGTRKRCCSSLKKCHSKFCRNTKSRCYWKGKATTVSLSKKCFTKKVSPSEIRNICCHYKKTCVGTHCEKKKQNCNVVRTVVRRNKEKCLLVSSKKGHCQRTRCCKWTEKCVNAKCTQSQKKCTWRGKATCQKRICNCLWKQKNDKCKQRKCCCTKRSCYGKQCVTKNAKCFWTGKKICARKNKRNCDWKAVGKTGRQLFCCVFTKVDPTCKKNCQKKKECKFVGKLHTNEAKRVCRYLEIAKNQARKQCCIVIRRCSGKKCYQKRSKCKFVGPIARNGCLWKKKKVCQKAKLNADFKCRMKVDPSFITFNGKSLNNISAGKQLIVKKGTFSIKAERSKWAKSVVTTKFFIAKGKKPLRSVISTVNAGRYVVNGKHITLKVNKSFTTHSLMIRRVSKNTAVVQTKKGSFIRIKFNNRKNLKGKRRWFQSQFLTATIGIRSLAKSKGLCVDGQNGTLKVKPQPVTKPTACQLILAAKVCRERKVPKKGLKVCQKRVLATNPPCPDKKKCKGKQCKKCKGKKCPKKPKCAGKLCSKCRGQGCIPKVPKCKGKKCPKQKCGKKQKLIGGKCVSTVCLKGDIFNGTKCVKAPSYFCRSNGDPHFSTFSGQHFDNYKVGDFVLTSSKRFKVHTRQIKWGGAAVNTRFAVQTNSKGGKVQVNSRDEVLINGNQVTLKVGETKNIPKGGSIRRVSESTFKVEGVDGSYVDAVVNKSPSKGAWPQDHYIDILVFSPTIKGVKGFCVASNQEIVAKGLFQNPQPAIKITPKKCSDNEKANAKLRCGAAFVQKKHMDECIKDVCASNGKLNPELFAKFEKLVKKDKKKQDVKIQKQIKVNKIKKIQKQVKGHFCHANGDPHFTTFKGRHFDNYKVGDFVLVKGQNFEVHTRQKKWGGAAVNTRFIVKSNEDKVEVISRDQVLINGKQVSFTVGKKEDLPKGGSVHRYSAAGYKVVGEDGSYVDARINVEPKPKSWPHNHYIDIAVFVPQSKGLTGFCVSPVEQVAMGLFSNFEEPKSLPKPKITKEERKVATQLCRARGVQLNHLKACAVDVVTSGNKLNPTNMVKFEKRLIKDEKRFIALMKKNKK